MRPRFKNGRKYSTCGPGYARGADPAGRGGVEVMSRCYGTDEDEKPVRARFKSPSRKYAYGGVQTVPWGACGRQMAATDSSAPELPPARVVRPVDCIPSETDEYGAPWDPCYMQHGHIKHNCPDIERCKSPMPYPDFSYRGIRGRTFGHADTKGAHHKNCAEHHKHNPNYMSIKNCHDMENYAEKSCEMIEAYGAPQWMHHKISEIRQHIGDVKHFLEHKYGRYYGHTEHDWAEHAHDPNYIAHQNLYVIADYAHYCCSLLKQLDYKIPAWAADKLARARTSMGDVYHYLDYHIFAHEHGYAEHGREYGRPFVWQSVDNLIPLTGVPANTRRRKKIKRMAKPIRKRLPGPRPKPLACEEIGSWCEGTKKITIKDGKCWCEDPGGTGGWICAEPSGNCE